MFTSKKSKISSVKGLTVGAKIGLKKGQSATVRAQYRVNAERKSKAEAILKAQGIKPSQAIDMFLAEVVRDHGFPFKCSGVPSKELEKTLKEVEKGENIISYKNEEVFFKSFKKL